MNDLHEARKQTKALLPFARAVVAQDEALDALADIGKQTAAAGEARDVAVRARAAAEAELSEVVARRDAAQGDADKAKQSLKQISADGQAIIDKARQQASQIVDDAKSSAAKIVSAADQSASSILSHAQGQKADVEKATAEAQNALDAVNSQIAAANQKLAETNAEIDRLRALFGR